MSVALFVFTLCNGEENEMQVEKADYTINSFILGTYTSEESVNGLLLFQYDTVRQVYSSNYTTLENANASFGVLNSSKTHYYSVSETGNGKVIAYKFSPANETMVLINAKSSRGDYPCYISLSPDETMLAVSNYGTGNVAIYKIDSKTGAISDLLKVLQHQGSSVNASRQEGPHAHWVRWSSGGVHLYVVDLGIDKIMRYDSFEGWDTRHVALDLVPGAGPRHLVFHPTKDTCYILNELSNSIVSANIDENGNFLAFQEQSTLPSDYSEHSQAGHIAISKEGSYVYVSNRGHDSIAVFEVKEDGDLERIQIISCGGEWPRFFSLTPDGNMLWVANRKSDSISIFSVKSDGSLKYDDDLALNDDNIFKQPVFLQFLVN